MTNASLDRWSDHFIRVGGRTNRSGHSKTTPTKEQVWQGCFEGKLLCVHSTVRLTGSNMAHFLVHSGARIGPMTGTYAAATTWTFASCHEMYSAPRCSCGWAN